MYTSLSSLYCPTSFSSEGYNTNTISYHIFAMCIDSHVCFVNSLFLNDYYIIRVPDSCYSTIGKIRTYTSLSMIFLTYTIYARRVSLFLKMSHNNDRSIDLDQSPSKPLIWIEHTDSRSLINDNKIIYRLRVNGSYSTTYNFLSEQFLFSNSYIFYSVHGIKLLLNLKRKSSIKKKKKLSVIKHFTS